MCAGDEVSGRELTDAGPDEQRQVMVRAVLLMAEEMLRDERTHLDGEMRERGGDRQTHALAARFAGQLQDRGFTGFLGSDEAGVVTELGQGVVATHERRGEFAFDEPGQDVLTGLRNDGLRGIVLGMLGGEGLVA